MKKQQLLCVGGPLHATFVEVDENQHLVEAVNRACPPKVVDIYHRERVRIAELWIAEVLMYARLHPALEPVWILDAVFSTVGPLLQAKLAELVLAPNADLRPLSDAQTTPTDGPCTWSAARWHQLGAHGHVNWGVLHREQSGWAADVYQTSTGGSQMYFPPLLPGHHPGNIVACFIKSNTPEGSLDHMADSLRYLADIGLTMTQVTARMKCLGRSSPSVEDANRALTHAGLRHGIADTFDGPPSE